jgi:Flp pilus assembly protein TadG
MRHPNYKRGESGNTMVEFALVAPFWIAMLFGTVAMGTNLTRTIQVVQTSRDLADMYAKGTDFSAAGMQNLMTGDGGSSASLVQGISLTYPAGTTGNAVIYFSQVRHVLSADNDCASTCANANSYVYVNYLPYGNTTLFSSYVGNGPDSTNLDSQGNTKNPLTDTSDKTNQALLFANTYTMPGNASVAYVVEVFMSSPDLSFLGFGGSGNYSRAVF